VFKKLFTKKINYNNRLAKFWQNRLTLKICIGLLLLNNLFSKAQNTPKNGTISEPLSNYVAKYDPDKKRIIVINNKGQIIDSTVAKFDVSIISNPLVTIANYYGCSLNEKMQNSIESAADGSIIYFENIYYKDLKGKRIKLLPITLIKGKDI
jgi:hypothetical protein